MRTLNPTSTDLQSIIAMSQLIRELSDKGKLAKIAHGLDQKLREINDKEINLVTREQKNAADAELLEKRAKQADAWERKLKASQIQYSDLSKAANESAKSWKEKEDEAKYRLSNVNLDLDKRAARIEAKEKEVEKYAEKAKSLWAKAADLRSEYTTKLKNLKTLV